MRHLLLILPFILLISGCSDDPNSVGISLVPKLDGLKIDSLQVTALTSTNYRTRVTGTSTIILLGRYSTLEARTAFQFVNIPTTRTTAVIDSAVLTFVVASRFMDSSGTISFEVHRMTRSWAESSVNWDSLQAANQIYSDTIDGKFNIAVSPADSLISIRIDSVAAHWMREGNSSPYGIILVPTVSLHPVVLGLRNLDLMTGSLIPALRVIFHDSLGVDSVIQTAYQGVSAADGPMPSPPTRLFLQAGVAYRGRLLFDVSSIPKNASVTSAALELHIDTSLSVLNQYSTDSLIVNFLPDSTKPDSIQLATLGVPTLTKTGFTFDIRNIVQNWVIGRRNQGLVLRAYGETWTIDRFACYDAFAAPGLRPRLRIKYTVLP